MGRRLHRRRPPCQRPGRGTLLDAGVPVVTIGWDPARKNRTAWISTADRDASTELLDLLTTRGARRICFICGTERNSWNIETARAYRAWCRAHGMPASLLKVPESVGKKAGRNSHQTLRAARRARRDLLPDRPARSRRRRSSPVDGFADTPRSARRGRQRCGADTIIQPGHHGHRPPARDTRPGSRRPHSRHHRKRVTRTIPRRKRPADRAGLYQPLTQPPRPTRSAPPRSPQPPAGCPSSATTRKPASPSRRKPAGLPRQRQQPHRQPSSGNPVVSLALFCSHVFAVASAGMVLLTAAIAMQLLA